MKTKVHLILLLICFSFSLAHGSSGINSRQLDIWDLSSSADPKTLISVNVPSTLLGALVEDGQYPSPYYSLNLQNISQSRFMVPWIYQTTFLTPSFDASNETLRAWITFQGLSYSGTLVVNNQLVMGQDELVGTVRTFQIDISSFLQFNLPNSIQLTINRPINSYVV